MPHLPALIVGFTVGNLTGAIVGGWVAYKYDAAGKTRRFHRWVSRRIE